MLNEINEINEINCISEPLQINNKKLLQKYDVTYQPMTISISIWKVQGLDQKTEVCLIKGLFLQKIQESWQAKYT